MPLANDTEGEHDLWITVVDGLPFILEETVVIDNASNCT